jgi:phenylacetate-CoA ligase
MFENFIRANSGRVQPFYDLMPAPARTLAASARGWLLTRNRYAPEMFDLLRGLRTHEKWSADEVAHHQLQALRRTVEWARRTVPFYKNCPQLEWRSADELSELPVLTRESVQRNGNRLISESVPGNERIAVATTGTTGASLQVSFSSAVARHNWAFRMRQWAWAGLEPRAPRITLFGSRVVPPQRHQPPYWVYNIPERQTLMSIFHLSKQTAPDYVGFLRQHQDNILESFPSVLGILADFILERGESIPMRVVFTDGEPLYPFLRSKIERAFKTSIFNSYGNTEFCGLIQECECHRMHLAPEYAFLEVLDENSRPVALGEEGFLVWTGFINDVMPLIRYRIGDRGAWLKIQSCPCGRAFPLVVPTITRESDLLRCPDGRIFSPRALNQVLKTATAFRFCQFVQTGPARVVVRAVPRNGKASEDLLKVRSDLQELLGRGMEVVGELGEAPLTRAGGKIPLIVDQRKR